MKIQRLFRGHWDRLFLTRRKMTDRRNTLREEYLKAADEKRLQAKRELAAIKVRNYYKQERAEERTARCRSIIDCASSHNDRRLKAFGDSCYGNDNVSYAISDAFHSEIDRFQTYKDGVDDERSRTEFINSRIFEIGPLWALPPSDMTVPKIVPKSNKSRSRKLKGIQFASTVQGSENMDYSVSQGSDKITPLPEISRRGNRMKIYFQSELSNITSHTIERLTHDFTKRNLFDRLRVLNEKQQRTSSTEQRTSSAEQRTSSAEGVMDTATSASTSVKSTSVKSTSIGGAGKLVEKGVILMTKKPKPGGLAARCKFKYPDKINDKPMEWLFEDDAVDTAFR